MEGHLFFNSSIFSHECIIQIIWLEETICHFRACAFMKLVEIITLNEFIIRLKLLCRCRYFLVRLLSGASTKVWAISILSHYRAWLLLAFLIRFHLRTILRYLKHIDSANILIVERNITLRRVHQLRLITQSTVSRFWSHKHFFVPSAAQKCQGLVIRRGAHGWRGAVTRMLYAIVSVY